MKMYKCPCGTMSTYGGYCKVCSRERYRKKRGIEGRPIVKRDILRKRSDLEIRKLIDEYGSLIAISKALGVSVSQVSLEISKRDIYQLETAGKGTRRKYYKPELIARREKAEHELCSKDAWINSPERKSFVNAGLMKNKSLKYK